ncbi:MAG: hypothetical protein JXB49_32365 [Bacteroidales bacterium]|nr:hypothetical protein [Bacteroidales bacterium]
MANFKEAYNKTMGHEGGYANNPFDKGGETYKGIARKYHPEWDGWLIIDAYKANSDLKTNRVIDDPELDELVYDFYQDKFWSSNRLDEITNQLIANELFDTGVNVGREKAARMLQIALNVLNRNERDYHDIKVDGIIGPDTIRLTNAYPRPEVLLKTLNGIQFSHYMAICQYDPSQEVFFQGWLKRA